MSRAAIKRLTARLLNHPPTPQECEATRVLLLELCPNGRLYIPSYDPQEELFNKAQSLRDNGWSIRRIARTLGISKSAVHRELSQNPVAKVDSDPPNV